jgi:hypothetical protein
MAVRAIPPAMPRRPPSRFRWLRRLGLLLLALVLIGAAGLAGALWWSLPAGEGELRLAGLSAPVEVTLDAQGSPASPPRMSGMRPWPSAGCTPATGCSRWS